MTLYWKYLGPGFDSRHLHQLFNNMQKLFENFREYLKESDQQNVEAQLVKLRQTDQQGRNELQVWLKHSEY